MSNTSIANDRSFMLKDARYKYVRLFSGDTLGQGTNTNSLFTAQLYNDTDLNRVKEFTIQSACVPNVFNNVDGDSIAVNYVPNGGGASVPLLLAIPDGFYSTAQLMAQLKTVIDASLPVGSTITFTQDPITNKISFTTVLLDSIQFEDIITNPLSTVSPKIGNNDLLAPATLGTFDAIPALAGEQYVFLNSQTLNLAKTRLSNGLAVSTTISLPVNVAYGQNIYYENNGDTTNDVIFNAPTDISNLAFTLRAQDGRNLPLPDNHPITIILKVFY